MALRVKSRKILIPDVPPVTKIDNLPTSYRGLVIAGIGVFCGSVVIAVVLFVFLGV